MQFDLKKIPKGTETEDFLFCYKKFDENFLLNGNGSVSLPFFSKLGIYV